MTRKNAQGNNPAIVPPRGLQFKITDTKLYVPAATLSKENYIKLLEQLKTGFKKTIYTLFSNQNINFKKYQY